MSAKTLIEMTLPSEEDGITPAYLERLKQRADGARKFGTYQSGGFTSKMWILPDGEIETLGMQHWEWLKSRPEVQRKFGLDLTKVPDEDTPVRLAALAHGFVRVNYEQKTGRMTVEGSARHWTRAVKDGVFALVQVNLKSIDHIQVNLFDENGRVVRNGQAQLFTYSDEEKLEHIPLVSESARGRALRAALGLCG
jgi:hypothetical protein